MDEAYYLIESPQAASRPGAAEFSAWLRAELSAMRPA
jgi:hypothetical protein